MKPTNDDEPVGPMPDFRRTGEFVRLFSECAQRLYAYILTMTGHDASTEDIFQETSVLLWQKFDDFEPGTDFLAWACRIAYLRVLNHWSSRRRSPVSFSDAHPGIAEDVAAMSERLDAELKALADCYQALPPAERELVDRRYAPGVKTREIAEAIGKPLSTVYRMLNRVHDMLFACIERKLLEEA
ncbi:ECF RNA polymerase sigma factor SigH [Planctomycetes bacterium Pan216]|uniref:ECF RNA polymerase sigma factor SigH n=1 Tax=Kolteria novifilia TaxID=2527975 RepID=A0A518AZY9_9BACT|nr:ECF RNA polymerase sigma factor SigH [Planctomycetes bacterium Pan216]